MPTKPRAEQLSVQRTKEAMNAVELAIPEIGDVCDLGKATKGINLHYNDLRYSFINRLKRDRRFSVFVHFGDTKVTITRMEP